MNRTGHDSHSSRWTLNLFEPGAEEVEESLWYEKSQLPADMVGTPPESFVRKSTNPGTPTGIWLHSAADGPPDIGLC
ncbi:MAG: hypothetical protein R3C11_08105 [Planctomycetaceae bacterium]